VSLLWICLLLFGADDFTSIQRKMDDIVKEHLKPGSRVYMSLKELNAYEQAQAVAIAPKAIRNAKVELGEGSGTASAMVDFLELNKERKGASNWLMDKILEGERPVKVSLHIQSHNGQARVDVDRVEIGGAAMQGPALDFLIQHYVTPQFPDAKVEQWFTLAHHMDHFEVHPAGVTIVLSK
jgi:hypothetical protein